MPSSWDVTKEAFDLLQNALDESEARVTELRKQLRRNRPTKDELGKRLEVLKHRLEKSEQNHDRWRIEAGHLEELVDNANAKIGQLRTKLEIAESGPDKLTKKEVNYWRTKAESFDAAMSEYKARIRTLRHDLNVRDGELSELRAAFLSRSTELSTAEDYADALNVATTQIKDYRHQIAILNATQARSHTEQATANAELSASLNQRDQTKESVAQINAAAETVESVRAEGDRAAETLKIRLKEREVGLQQATVQSASLEAENARLQKELRDQKECAENVSEVANDRLDKLNKVREQNEETEERHEEAVWRLSKTQHFERLVKRRRGLISSLIAAIRAKSKANTALKAGLDSLRRYKASAQATQQKLLAQIEHLTSELGEATETIERYKDAPVNKEKPAENQIQFNEVENRINAQVDLIKSLEDELQLSKVIQRDLSNKMVEAQKKLSGQRQADDAVSTKSETDRDDERLMIDALEQKVTELRSQLAIETNATGSSAGTDSDVHNDLKTKLEQSEAKILELTELADVWKRKYEFLATEAPEIFQTHVTAEK